MVFLKYFYAQAYTYKFNFFPFFLSLHPLIPMVHKYYKSAQELNAFGLTTDILTPALTNTHKLIVAREAMHAGTQFLFHPVAVKTREKSKSFDSWFVSFGSVCVR